MNPYDNRHVTLDPGLTLLALRGLRRRDGHYPFLDAWPRRREAPSRAEFGGAALKTLLRALVTMSSR
jgi:hypothetical protein